MDIGEDEPQAEESWTLKLLIDTCVWLDLGRVDKGDSQTA